MEPRESQVESIFFAALDRASEVERAAYVAGACAGDEALQLRVERLLAAQPHVGSFLAEKSSAFAPTIVKPPLTEAVATVIGPYKLLEQIGEGGFGVVFLAEQTAPVKRKVAFKILKPGMDTRQVIARFEAERQALALMDHPNIAKVFDAGATEAGRPYFVMELVKGVPITDYCDQHQFTPKQRLELFVTVCQAVQHAHQKGIIHRDIKPSNVLVTLHDDKPIVKVIDFGIAKATSGPLTDKTLNTGFAQFVGTPLYMSPEQAALSGLDIDTRSDIYSLGVLLYELLTGTTPFDKTRLQAAAFDEVRRIIREEEPEKPSTRLSELSNGRGAESAVGRNGARSSSSASLASIAAQRHTEPRKLRQLIRGDLDWIVMKALEKDRARRYETANGFAADILHYLADQPVLACPPSRMYQLRKFARRNKAVLATGALISTMLIVAITILAVSNVRVIAERNAKDKALAEKVQALGEKDAALSEKQAALTQAEINFAEAKRQERLAKEHERNATEQTVLAKRRLYASQLNLAMQAWRAGEVPRVLELLEGQRPGMDEEDLRGFEWFYLWRLCNGGGRKYLHGHTAAVLSLAFSPDGSTLASAGWGGSVCLWDTATGRERMVLQGQDHSPWEVVYSPDGKKLASSGKETISLILWDAGTGQPLHTIAGSVVGLTFSRDGSTIAGSVVTGSGVHAKVWDVDSGAERMTLADAGVVIGFLPDEKTLVTGMGQYLVTCDLQFWDLETGSRKRTIPLRFTAALLSPDGTRLATSSGSDVEFWDTATGMSAGRIPVPDGVGPMAFSPDGRLLAGGVKSAGTTGRTAMVWDVASTRPVATEVHVDAVGGIAFSPDGKTLASSTLAGDIKLWDMTPPEEAATIAVGGATSIRFDAGGRTLLVGNSGPTKVIDVAAGKEVAVLPFSGAKAISADAKMLAGPAGSDEGVRWNVGAGRAAEGFALPRPPDSHPGMALSPDGTTVATYYRFRDDVTVKLWDMSAQQPRTLRIDPPQSNRNAVNCAEFSPDGKLLAAGFQFQWVTVWNVATGKVKLQFSQKPSMMWVDSVAFSPDSQSLAVGTDLGAVTLWDIESGRQLTAFRGHVTKVFALDFSPDGRTLASAGADKTVKLWDVVTGQERCALPWEGSPVVQVRFSPDGATLAAADRGTVKLWRALTDPEALARRARFEHPNDPVAAQLNRSAWTLAASDKLDERDPAQAVELAKKAIELNPKNANYWNTLAVAHFRAGDLPSAIAALDKSEELSPGIGVYDFFRAMALWQLGDQDAARDYFEKTSQFLTQRAKRTPQDQWLPWMHRLQREAAELLELPVHTPPRFELPPGAITRETQIAELLGRRAALDQRAAVGSNDRWEGWKLITEYYQLAVALRDLEELPQAEAVCRHTLDAFRRLANEDPQEIQFDFDVAWSAHLLAGLLERRGRFEEAEPFAREAIERFQSLAKVRPDRPEYLDATATAYGPLMRILAHFGKHEEAERIRHDIEAARTAAEELRQTLPSPQKLLDNARPFAEVRDWQRAAAELKPGMIHQPCSDMFLCFSTALAQLLAGDVEAYVRLTGAMPIASSSKFGRGERLDILRTSTLHPRGVADRAALITLAQSAYAAEANNWSAQNLGMAHYRAGEYDKALPWMEASQKFVEWYLFYPALAMTHHQLGHADEARQWLEKANQFFREFVPPGGERLKTLEGDSFWQDWAYFELMLQEANALIGEAK